MISPYKGTFRVSQAYRNLRANGTYHQGYDLVGITDKNIYCPVYGTVVRAGWECATLPKRMGMRNTPEERLRPACCGPDRHDCLLYVFWAPVQNQRDSRPEVEAGRPNRR